MPKGEGPPVERVTLVCGHIRRYFKKSKTGLYYCLTCDDHKEVKGKLQDPRARPYGRTKE